MRILRANPEMACILALAAGLVGFIVYSLYDGSQSKATYDKGVQQAEVMERTRPFLQTDANVALAQRMDGDANVDWEGAGQIHLITETHVYRVEFLTDWAVALSNALWHAKESGKQPGVVMLVADDSDADNQLHIRRLQLAAPDYVDIQIVDFEELRKEHQTEKTDGRANNG